MNVFNVHNNNKYRNNYNNNNGGSIITNNNNNNNGESDNKRNNIKSANLEPNSNALTKYLSTIQTHVLVLSVSVCVCLYFFGLFVVVFKKTRVNKECNKVRARE